MHILLLTRKKQYLLQQSSMCLHDFKNLNYVMSLFAPKHRFQAKIENCPP